jgi:hypothetical protein
VDGNVRKARAPRGVQIASEGNTLEGEAQGRSNTSVLAGSVVDAAKGVAKPRTWHAAAKGFAVIMRVHRLGKCRRAGKPRIGSRARRVAGWLRPTDERRCPVGLGRHVSEEERKRRKGLLTVQVVSEVQGVIPRRVLKHRTGWAERMTVLALGTGSLECTQPHERPPGSPLWRTHHSS